MEIIKIDIKEKIATNLSDTVIVCGNNDYFVEFTFDSEWENIKVKTARFYFNFKHIDIVFEGNTCQIPLLEETQLLKVGVFADNVKTTTDAEIKCVYSIKKYGGNVYEPSPDVYAQIMALLEEYIVEEKKDLTTEQVSELPTPSNDTLGKIYLLSSVNGNNNIYDEYITVEKAEGQFAWEKIGSVGFTLIVDDKLSNKSENPVQNKVIAKELENKVTLDTDQTITGEKSFQGVVDFLKSKGNIIIYGETDEYGNKEPVLFFTGPFGTTKIKRNTIINRNSAGSDAQTFTFPEESGTLATEEKVEDALSGKVDKVTTAYKLYGTAWNGEQKVYSIGNTSGNSANQSIPWYFVVDSVELDRVPNGSLITATPQKPYAAANKKYVDEQIASVKKYYKHTIRYHINGAPIYFDVINTNSTKYTVNDMTSSTSPLGNYNGVQARKFNGSSSLVPATVMRQNEDIYFTYLADDGSWVYNASGTFQDDNLIEL